MIDARNVYRKVNQTLNDFSPEQLEGLTNIVKAYRGEQVDFTKNQWLKEHFPEGKYQDVEGLCKIVDLEEIKENDYSLTPGRYVGYSIQIDEDFDYKARMKEIQSELAALNKEASDLMNQILSVKL